MLNPKQFGVSNPNSPTKTNQAPKVRNSSSGYKFPPPFKSQEERDLMEAKARALNVKTARLQAKGL